ncbi:hypothetical protein AB1Y20_009467 [Prymnesium parvum]|uniref:Major facilitator superfamily (MFS) profile domain-containing protein n=1 Tax=Prymnesium parvum TaxID=97485 RepID=A0AB34K4J4_PRYPA
MMELSEPHQRQEDPRQGACEEEGSAVVDEPVAISVRLSPGRRLLLLLIALATVGVFAVVGPFVLAHESPRWLLVMGKENNARALLRKIAAKEKGALNDGRPLQLRLDTGSGKIDMNNGAHCADGAGSMGTKGGGAGAAENPEASLRPEATTYASWHHKLPQLRHHALWRLHAAGCLVTFCLNFGAKGAEIWLGTYIDELGVGRNNATLRDSASTSAGEPDWLEAHFSRLIYFGLISGKIIGDVVNLTASQAFGRLWCLRICFWGAGVCVLLVSQVRSLWVLLLLTTLQGAFQDMLWCNIYMYLAEAFPTSIRSTAFGLSMGIGRSGGVVSSALGGAFNSVQLAFVLYGAAFIVGGVIVSCLGNETSGRPLRDAVS